MTGLRAVQLGDLQQLARIDEIGVIHLWICLDDLAGAHLILYGQLPHGVAGNDLVGKRGSGDGEQASRQNSCGQHNTRLFHSNTSQK